MVIIFPAQSQVITVNQPEPSSDLKSENVEQTQIDFSSSREEDIFVFENNMKMFQNAIEAQSVPEAEVFLNKNVEIAKREIQRAKRNLEELKAGNTQHLEEWRKENSITEPLNISLEINRLSDNIKSMEYMYKDLIKVDMTKISDTRATSTWVGDMKITLKNMNKNLKYESDKKIIQVEQPPVNETLNAGGKAIITQNRSNDEVSSDNLPLNDFYTARTARISQFKLEKNNYQSQLQASDYKSARRTYKSLLELMQSEIDANIWLKAQKDAESSKMATINVDEVSPIIEAQQKILDQASKIKIPTVPSGDFNPSESLEMIEKFEKTLH
jgi:hypothetical protein